MLIGSLVELYVGLHSHLCFSLLEKLVLKVGSTPPRHLFDTLLSVELLKHFFKRNLDTSSTPAGSIELLFLTLTLSCSIASSIPQLSKTRSSIPISTDPLIPLDTCICRDSLATYIRPLCDPKIISLRSLSRYFFVSFPKNSHLTPNLFLRDSSSFFKFLLTW